MRKKLIIGDVVCVNKDIHRYEEVYQLDERNKGLQEPNPKTLEEYQSIDWSIWRRKKILYSKKGDTGTILDVFHDLRGGYKQRLRLYAKIQIDDKIKTFRFTSLDKKIE